MLDFVLFAGIVHASTALNVRGSTRNASGINGAQSTQQHDLGPELSHPLPSPPFQKQRSQELVFDFGFFNGMDSWAYLHENMKVVAVEADPSLVDSAKKNPNFIPYIKTGQLTVLNLAIAPLNQDKDYWMNFYLNKCTKEWNSFYTSIGCRSCAPPYPEDHTRASCTPMRVLATPCASVLRQYGTPKYFKLDIEGAEAGCYHAMKSDPTFLPPYISAEVGDATLVDRLSALGYQSFKLVRQKSGISGEWGDAALDCRAQKLWRSKHGARQELQAIFQKAPAPFDICPGSSVGGSWYDLHASMEPSQTW